MEINHDFYKDSEKVIDIYNFAIKYWSDAMPSVRVQRLYQVQLGELALFRLYINSIATIIARTNEIINDLESSIKKEEYNQKIDDFIDKLGFFDKIASLVPLTYDEKRQKIKNCLAHSNYKIVENTEYTSFDDKYKILIENEYIKGKITLKELDELRRFFTSLSDELDTNQEIYTGTEDLMCMKTANNRLLDSAIDKIVLSKKCKDIIGGLPRNITFIGLGYYPNDETQKIDPNQQELIKNYIKYIGLTNWINLTPKERTTIFGRHIKFMLANKVDFRQNGDYVLTLINNFLTNGSQEWVSRLENFKYDAPFAYVSSILDLGYFCFNYLREAHKKDNLDGFNFHDFNLSGIKYSSPFEPSERFVDESAIINGFLSEEENKKRKITATITSLEKNKENLERATTIPEAKKCQLLSDNNQSRIKKYTELKDSEIRINAYKEQLKTATSYVDSSNFFRHLRNSFAHGFYSIDYSKALKNKKLDDIVFHFEDYNIDPNNREKRTTVFSADITAKRLIQLLNDFGSRIKNNVDTKDQELPPVFISTLGQNKITEQRVNEMAKTLQKQNINVVRIPKK